MLFSRPRKGPVAEWLGRALQKLPQRFESALDLKKNIDRIKILRKWQLQDLKEKTE